jgi:hypothetical protein
MNYVRTVLQKALLEVQETKRALRVFTNFDCEQEYRKITLIENQIEFHLTLCGKRKSDKVILSKGDYKKIDELRYTYKYKLTEICQIYNTSPITLSNCINRNKNN